MFKLIRFSILLCLITISGALWAKDPSEQKITLLKSMPIVKTTLMSDFLREKGQKVEFDNEVYLITLENGTKAVFKKIAFGFAVGLHVGGCAIGDEGH